MLNQEKRNLENFDGILSKTNLIKIRSFGPQVKDQTKPHTKVKSCDLYIMHDDNVMLRRKLSSDWLNTYVTEQGFR